MLDEGPRRQPFEPSSLEPSSLEPSSLDPAAPGPPGSLPAAAYERLDPDSVPPDQPVTASPGTAAPSTTALIAADMSHAWAGLDQSARSLFGTSIGAIVVVLAGLPLSVWDSAPFALLVLAASTITAVTAWFGASPLFRDLPIPRPTIELVATLVAVLLALVKVVEILFHLDTDGIVGLVAGGILLAATLVEALAAQRRGADPLAVLRGDRGTKIAAIGLALVVVGWAINLAVSFWTMGQAALPLAVLTIAALTVAEAPRIPSPVPVAWAGAGIGGFGALLALMNWSDLVGLGRTGLVLEPGDFVGLIVYTVGSALIIAGGTLSGRAVWAAAHPSTGGATAEG